MTPKTYYKTVAYIFTIIAILHSLRLAKGWEAVISGVVIPMWVSVAALILAGYLAYRGFNLAKKHG